MSDVIVGKGNLSGKGVYANRNFHKGEVIKTYNIRSITEIEYKALSEFEKQFTHTRDGITYLYGEPDRYTNHSLSPNTVQDFEKNCDIALRDIEKGEMITTDATREDY